MTSPNDAALSAREMVTRAIECADWIHSWASSEYAMKNAVTLHYDMAGKTEPLLRECADEILGLRAALAEAERERDVFKAGVVSAHAEVNEWRDRLEWTRSAVQSIDALLRDAKLPNVLTNGGDIVEHVRSLVSLLAEREKDTQRWDAIELLLTHIGRMRAESEFAPDFRVVLATEQSHFLVHLLGPDEVIRGTTVRNAVDAWLSDSDGDVSLSTPTNDESGR